MPSILPRYPIYIPSKSRHDVGYTADVLKADGVPFRLVVEPQERDAYARAYGDEYLLVLPFSNLGLGSIPARNWIKEHAISIGAERHWCLDDNLRGFFRRHKSYRRYCDAGAALRVAEDFVDRYDNVAVAGLNYTMNVPEGERHPPFQVNSHVYSCMLLLSAMPFSWRGRYNEDTDLCLQALADGWCTVLFNAFLVEKKTTMTMRGGNTKELYQSDGRLHMARSLERMWPGVVETKRRHGRPQHVIKDAWKRFDTPLKLKPGIDLSTLEPNEYGLALKRKKPPRRLGDLEHGQSTTIHGRTSR